MTEAQEQVAAVAPESGFDDIAPGTVSAAEPLAPQAAAQTPEAEAAPVVAPVAAPPVLAAAPAAQPPATIVAVAGDSNSVSIWPFVAYVGIWALYAGALIWQLLQVPAGVALFDAPVYRLALAGGIALESAGLAMIVAVWYASWDRPGSTRYGLLVSALIKGAIAMFVGTCLWWVALIVLDRIRLGSFM